MNARECTRPPAFEIHAPDEPWVDLALCSQVDPEMFFPETGGSIRDAKRICAMCPVTDECLRYALENDERFGVWGNKTAVERRKMKRIPA